jgi:translation initiation factor IF-3
LGKSKLFWRTDTAIRAPEVRLIGSDGTQLGVVKTSEALAKAKEEGLTLVEVAASAVPPVAKIVDFGKFRYQEEKKIRKQNKGAKGGELKEIRFSPFIGTSDYEVRLKRVKEFLGEKNKVKVVVVFLGRQMNSKPFGYKLIERIKADLGENISVDMEPKFLGRHLMTIISPVVNKNAKSKNEETNNK